MDKPLKKAVLQCFVAFVFYLIGLYQNWSENKVVDVKAFDEEELNQTSNQSGKGFGIYPIYEHYVPLHHTQKKLYKFYLQSQAFARSTTGNEDQRRVLATAKRLEGGRGGGHGDTSSDHRR